MLINKVIIENGCIKMCSDEHLWQQYRLATLDGFEIQQIIGGNTAVVTFFLCGLTTRSVTLGLADLETISKAMGES